MNKSIAALLAALAVPVAILVTLLVWTALYFYESALGAPPAPVESKPCVEVNTAKVNDTFTIVVFRCQPENGPPYLLNTVGFMKDEQ
jgi:hypothetical protein